MSATSVSELKKIAEGREAEMYAWEDGKVLRLYRGGFMRSSAEFQIEALRGAAEAGVRVPAVYGTTEVDGRFGIIQERIDGIDLLTLIGRKPWKVWWIGGISGRTQAEMGLRVAPEAIPSYHDRASARIRGSDDVPASYVEPALAALDELPRGDSLMHGDLHPGNIMVQNGEVVVLDWSNISRGDPHADLGRTILTMRMGDPPPGTAAFIRVMAVFARFILLDAHMRAYRRVRQPDAEMLKRWQLPVAVYRLTEGIEAERPKLIKHIDALLDEE